jgi:hypothetical protein
VAWFGGVWDNQEQVWFETEGRAQVPAAERHARIHAVHRRVDLPAFGRYVFYVEEYRDDDASRVSGQRLVAFESARGRGVLMRVGTFADPAAVRGAQDEPAKLAGLRADEVRWAPGCDVYWRAEADQYAGEQRGTACESGAGAARRYSQQDLVLSAAKYWRLERTFESATGRLAAGEPAVTDPLRLNRARLFDCAVNVYGSGYLAGPSPDDEHLEHQRIHSQGGTIRFQRKSDGRSYQLRLRDKEYPYYETRSDFMFLSVREGDGPFIAYSLHDPGASFIGFNLGWLSVACERIDPPQH